MTATNKDKKDCGLTGWKILLLTRVEYLAGYLSKFVLPTVADSEVYPESTKFKTTIASRLNGRVIPRKKKKLLTTGLFGSGSPVWDEKNCKKFGCKTDKRKVWGFSPDGKTWWLGEVSAISNGPNDSECHQVVSFSLKVSTIDEVIANVHPMVIIEKIRKLALSIDHQLKNNLQDFDLRILTPICSLYNRAGQWHQNAETTPRNAVVRIDTLDLESLSDEILNNRIIVSPAADGFVNLDAELCEDEEICWKCGRIYAGEKECCKK